MHKKTIKKLNIFNDTYTTRIYDEEKEESTILDNVDILVINKINEIIEVINNEYNK